MDANPNQAPEQPEEESQEKSTPRSKWTRFLPWILLIVFFVAAWFLPSLLGQGGAQSAETVSYTTFVEQVNANNVKSVTITDYAVTGVFNSPVLSADGTTKSTQFTTTVPQFGNDDLITLLQQHHVAITVQPSSSGGMDFLLNILLFFGPIALMILLF
ncbi:MAG: ATP-dependent metallopeptidase FtsH/Yme1/Tma family protein, partial [Ktedonobacteraceae bacterium]